MLGGARLKKREEKMYPGKVIKRSSYRFSSQDQIEAF